LAPQQAGQRLQAVLALRRAEFDLAVALDVPAGESVAILGPNGAGKSTVLAMLAGLLRPDSGTVTLGGRELTVGTESGSRSIAPEHRRVGLMGQNPLLFPHLSALENVAFGPRAAGRTHVQARAVALDWLDRMGLRDFQGRRPAQLSGGQRQRVALARALAAEPHVLLLDEPLGALDAVTVPEIRQVLRAHLRASGTTSLLVTHDVVDAAVLCERIIVLEDGRIVDDGPTATVLSAPRSRFGATVAGLNLVTGQVRTTAVKGTVAELQSAAGVLISGVAAQDLSAGDVAAAVFRPSAVSVFTSAVAGSPRNNWRVRIGSLEPGGAAVRLRSAADPVVAVDVTPAAVAELALTPGAEVYLLVKATEVLIHRR